MNEAARLPADTRMGPVQLRVSSLRDMLPFYRDALGFRVLRETRDEATLGADEPLVRLVEDPRAPPRPPRTSGLFHVAYLLPERAALGRFVRHLIDHEVPVEGASDHLVSEALYLSDPEGNGVEVYADRPRASWRWQGARLHMATLPMDVRAVLAAGEGAAWQGAPDGSVVGHVHLNVGDVNAAERYYTGDVGFDLTTRYGEQATFLSAGGYHHHLAANTWNGLGAPAPPEGSLGIDHYTVLVPERSDLDALAQRIRDAREDEGELLLRDPAGNRLRVRALA